MNKNSLLKTVASLMVFVLLFSCITGCRKVRSHKKYITEYEDIKVPVEYDGNDSQASSDFDNDNNTTDNGTSKTGDAGTSAGADGTNGIVTSSGKTVIPYVNEFLFSEYPTFSWSELAKGQSVNLKLYSSDGVLIFSKSNISGNSYKCPKKLEDSKTYTLIMTYNDTDGKEKVVNAIGENGKTLKCIAKKVSVSGKDYTFNGSISLEVLNNYLDKAVGYNIANSFGVSMNGAYTDEVMRFLLNVGAKYVQRAAGEWYPSSEMDEAFDMLTAKIAAVHSVDPDIIFEGAIFETSGPEINEIAIPEWVFKAFGLTPENRNFNVKLTLSEDGYGASYWDDTHHIPDVTQLETQMFIYYRACSLIDAGFESIHLGQVMLTGSKEKDSGNATYTKLISMIRDYAKENARRGYVLINAHNLNFRDPQGNMLADFIMAPNRVHAPAGSVAHEPTEENPQICIIEKGYWNDSVYQSGISGTSPSGWFAEKYPYLVEFDNYGGVMTDPTDPNAYVWGKDEIAWFVAQPSWYRKEFMNYLVSTIDSFNENGHTLFVGHRGLDYYANNPSVLCSTGSGDEDFIKSFFAKR